MKKLLFLGAFALVVLQACSIFGGGKKNTPEYVAKAFLTHFQKLEFNEAAEYGTENTKMLLSLFRSIGNMVPDDQKAEVPQSDVVIHSCETSGYTAVCHYTANGKTESIDLIKQDGKWLVDLKKEQKGE